MNGVKLSPAKIGFVMAALLGAQAAGAQAAPGLRVQPNGAQKPSAAVPLDPPALPANGPTAPLQPAATATISTVRRARVDYTNGLLTVTANNSSLNQILGSIARATGIKIAGGVTDERVFGTYGPVDLPAMLAILLDGTGSNRMLSGDTPGNPQTLTLTPRQGGATPPSPPMAQGSDDPDPVDLPPQLTPRTADAPVGAVQQPVNPPQPNAFTPPTVQPSAQPDAAAAPAATTTDQSPNGVKTPQQIYDQLMKLQSQQPKPQQ